MKSRGPKPPFGSVRRSPNRTGGDDFNEPDTPHPASGEFITKYPATCGGCGRSLSAGERARFNDADEKIKFEPHTSEGQADPDDGVPAT